MINIIDKKIGCLFGHEDMHWVNFCSFKPIDNSILVYKVMYMADFLGIKTIGDLINENELSMLRVKNYGMKTHSFLKHTLKKYGLKIHDQSEKIQHSTKRIGNHLYYVQHSSLCECKLKEFESK